MIVILRTAMSMEAVIIINKDLKSIGKPKGYKRIKGILLLGLLVFVSMAAAACSKPVKNTVDDNSAIEDTGNRSTGMPTDEAEQMSTQEQEPTAEPTSTQGQEPTAEPIPTQMPAPTSEPAAMSDFIPSEEVFHSATAFVQGDYLFYKSGKLTRTVISSLNQKTLDVSEITAIEDSYFNSSEFFLKGSDIYYHAEGDIYRVGVDGRNKKRLLKGEATILGFHGDNLFALDRKAGEIIRIDKNGEKQSLVKLNSVNSLEAVMVKDGFYYISKSTNNTLKGNNPIDRLYYIDFDGKDKTEIYTDLDVYDLKLSGDEIFLLALSEAPETVKVIKVKDRKATTIYSTSKEELVAQGCNFLDKNNVTLLGVNTTHVYYGIDFNNGKEMNIYSVGTGGENHRLYRNAYDIKGINPAAYFRRGDMDGGFLKIVFDCDEDPVEVYLIDLQDDSVIQFEGGYYLSGTIDVEGDYVYYLKSSQYDHYSESPETYKYSRSKLSELK